MSQYFTDFSDQPTGANPPEGWTRRWSNRNWTVTESPEALSGKLVRYTSVSASRTGLSWDILDSDPDRADSEVLALFLITANQRPETFVHLRGAGSTTTDVWGYRFGHSRVSNNIQILKFVNGVSTSLATASYTAPYGTPFWVRGRAEGDKLSLKVWLYGDSEPSTWNLETTDSSVPDAGFIGFSTFDPNYWDILAVGVGTNGETAPAEEISGDTVSQESLYSNSNTFYNHTAVAQTVTISAPLLSNSHTFYEQDVIQDIVISPPFLINSHLYYTHTIGSFSSIVQNQTYENSNTFYSHSTSVGEVLVEQDSILENYSVFYNNTIISSGLTIPQTDIYDNIHSFYSQNIVTTFKAEQDYQYTNNSIFFISNISQDVEFEQTSLFENSNVFYEHIVGDLLQYVNQDTIFENTQVFHTHKIKMITYSTVRYVSNRPVLRS